MNKARFIKISLRIVMGILLGMWCIITAHRANEEKYFWLVFIMTTLLSGFISVASEFVKTMPKTLKSSAEFTLMWMLGLLIGGVIATFFTPQLKFIWHLMN